LFPIEARVTVLTCQWLMGPSKVNIIDLPNGESWDSGVMIILKLCICFDMIRFVIYFSIFW